MQQVKAEAEANEAVLAELACAGDKRALDELIRLNYNAMYRLALRYTRSPEVAADVVQDSCVQVIRNIEKFRRDARFRSWMSRIVINCALIHYRKNKRWVYLDAAVPKKTDDVEPCPESEALTRQQLELAANFLQSGREGHYQLFLKRFVAGESIRSISQMTGVSVPSVKTRLHRARRRLREHMRDVNQQDALAY